MSNPFADSSAAQPHGASDNPFEDPYSQKPKPYSHVNDSFASIDTGSQSQPQAYASGGGSGAGYSRREQELEARERAVRDAEARVAAQQAELATQANNWPPFYPLIHHDISDLPEQHRTVGKLLYYQWLALALTLIVNLVGCVLLLVGGAAEGGADMGASVMYVPVIGAASFFAWYRPIYLGLSRTEGRAMAFWFYIYFLFAGFHLLFSAYMAVGIPSTGSAGLINTISAFGRGSIVAAVFGVIASTGWVLQAAGGGLLYKRIWDFKNGNGDITFQAASPLYSLTRIASLVFCHPADLQGDLELTVQASDQFKAASIKTIILHQSKV